MHTMQKLVYYSMQHPTESEQIGTWPQLEIVRKYWKVKNNYEMLTSRAFPEVTPNLDTFILKRGAKRTDMLSAEMLHDSVGVLISDRFKSLLENYQVRDFRLYTCCLVSPFDENFKNRKEPELFCFNFLHLIHNRNIVDFPQSMFEDLKTNQMLTVDREEQLPISAYPIKIALKETPDLFRDPFGINILVSEQLKSAIEAAGITGVWFEDRIICEYYRAE